MRRAEFITAGILALLSIYLMWKSTELEIGYVSDAQGFTLSGTRL